MATSRESREASEAYIGEMERYLTDYYGGRNKEVEANRLAREQADFTANDVPEAYRASTEVVDLPRIPDQLQRMQSIVTDDDPAWEVPPADETQSAQRNTSLRERWLAGSFERMAEESGRDAWRMAMDAALADGMGVLKLTYLPDAWRDDPATKPPKERDGETIEERKKALDQHSQSIKDYRKSARFPFSLEDVDLLTYHPVPGRPVTEVLEISERPTVPSLRALNARAEKQGDGKYKYRKLRKGEKFPAGGGAPGLGATTKCIERWTEETVEYYFDGQLVDTVEHHYGFVPYVEITGYTTSSRDPKRATVSVIASQRGLVKQLRRILTIWMNWAYLTGFPFLIEKDDTPGGSSLLPDQRTVREIKPGDILRGVDFLQGPQAGKDLKELAQVFQVESDRAGLSAVMYGAGAGTSSGYQVASLQAAAQSVLKPIIRSGGIGIARIGRMLQELIDRRVKEEVYVWGNGEEKGQKNWLGLGPKDIKGYYPVKATLRPLMPLDEVAQRDSAIRMKEAGLWDPETALKHTGEQQPEEILDRVWAYRFIEESGISSKIAEDAARRKGLIPAAAAQPPGMPAGPPGMGGPGIGAQPPLVPSVPGAPGSMPLVPPAPMGAAMVGGANQPMVQRQPGGPNMSGPMGEPA